MFRTARLAVSLGNHKRKGLISLSRTPRSDRARKTRTALLEMRTALIETPTAKSMR